MKLSPQQRRVLDKLHAADPRTVRLRRGRMQTAESLVRRGLVAVTALPGSGSLYALTAAGRRELERIAAYEADVASKPLREVVHIKHSVGSHGGEAWTLTLACGHLAVRPFKVPTGGQVLSRPIRLAPHHARCIVCRGPK